ncbi:ATP-binding protein [Mesorhizobium sp. M0622]|uniref:hypothetical protein n=1 Tax=unclassified Mesorhizobium TaxID=325217 RepID=UPI003335F6A9
MPYRVLASPDVALHAFMDHCANRIGEALVCLDELVNLYKLQRLLWTSPATI